MSELAGRDGLMFNYRDSDAALEAKLEVLAELEMKYEDDRRGWLLFGGFVFALGVSGLIWNPWEREERTLLWIGVATALGSFASVVVGIRAWVQLYEVRRFTKLLRDEVDFREVHGKPSIDLEQDGF